MAFDFPQSAELSESEKALVDQVVARWGREGKLVFRRLPNFFAALVALTIGGFLVFCGAALVYSKPWRPLVPAAETVSVPWPYETPAKIVLAQDSANGLRIAVASGQFYDVNSKTIELHPTVIDAGALAEHVGPSATSVSVSISGEYASQTRTVHRISRLLEVLAQPDTDVRQEAVKAQKAAEEVLRLLEALEDESGYVDVRGLAAEDLKLLHDRGFLLQEEAMIAPKPVQLTVTIPLTTGPIDSGVVFSFLFTVVIGIPLLIYALNELLAIRRGNIIALTPSAFAEDRRRLFGLRNVTIPWDRVSATEESSNFLSVISALLGTDEKLVIEDTRSHKTYKYRPRTILRYQELRAVVIAKVGLSLKSEVWRYE